MTCGEVSKHLDGANSQGWSNLPAQVREHVGKCQSCKALWNFLTGQEPSELTSELRSRISRTVQQSLEPVKPLPSTRLLTLGFLLIFGAISAALVGLSGLGGMNKMGNMEFAVMLGIIAAAAFLVALTLSREMAPGEKRVLTAPRLFLLLLVPPVPLGIPTIALGSQPQHPARQLEMFSPRFHVFPAGGRARRDASTARRGFVPRRCGSWRRAARGTRRRGRTALRMRHEQCRACGSRPSRSPLGGRIDRGRDRATAGRYPLAPNRERGHLATVQRPKRR